MLIKNYTHVLIVTLVFFLPFATSSYDHMSEFNNCSAEEEEFVYEVVHLIRKCFTKYNRLIALSGEMSDKLVENIHKLDSKIAVIKMSTKVPLIDKIYTFAKQWLPLYSDEYFFRFEYKAQGFLLAASSQPILRRQMRELKNARWWNSGGLFFIIGDGTTINRCKNAKEFLWLAWRYNILSSIFLCHDENKSLILYSYNPYNTMAPKSWLKVGQLHGRDGHPWTLFKRNTSENPEECTEIFFDKTKTLENYKIRSNSMFTGPRLGIIDHTKADIERYGGEDGEMMKNIFRFLNASTENTLLTGTNPMGSIDQNGTYVGMLNEIFSGRVDISLNGRYMVDMWKLGMSYPHTTIGMCFLVKSHGNIPKWMNLAFVYDIKTMLGLSVVTLLTTAVLIYYTSVSAGCLNSLRLIISASLVRLPRQLPARLFLTHVFFLFMITNGTFQGRLISLITKPRAYHNLETQTELANAGYKVVSYEPFAKYIDDPILRSNFIPIGKEECVERIIHGESMTACIDECEFIYRHSKHYTELHLVDEILQVFHIVYLTTLDWPLLERVDQIIQRLSEAGFPRHWRARSNCFGLAKEGSTYMSCYYGIESSENQSSILSLQDLVFIFQWLLCGLFFAGLVFVYEILSVRYSIRIQSTCQK